MLIYLVAGKIFSEVFFPNRKPLVLLLRSDNFNHAYRQPEVTDFRQSELTFLDFDQLLNSNNCLLTTLLFTIMP